jgi:hypothetical protein
MRSAISLARHRARVLAMRVDRGNSFITGCDARAFGEIVRFLCSLETAALDVPVSSPPNLRGGLLGLKTSGLRLWG